VPWCATCDRFLSPPTVTPEGNCPHCGRPVEAGQAHPREEREGAPPVEDDLGPVPAHLKIMGVALVVYLGWRFFQGVEWVIHRLS
jgi:hypothetical protein